MQRFALFPHPPFIFSLKKKEKKLHEKNLHINPKKEFATHGPALKYKTHTPPNDTRTHPVYHQSKKPLPLFNPNRL